MRISVGVGIRDGGRECRLLFVVVVVGDCVANIAYSCFYYTCKQGSCLQRGTGGDRDPRRWGPGGGTPLSHQNDSTFRWAAV